MSPREAEALILCVMVDMRALLSSQRRLGGLLFPPLPSSAKD
jgi:hypothetical protein